MCARTPVQAYVSVGLHHVYTVCVRVRRVCYNARGKSLPCVRSHTRTLALLRMWTQICKPVNVLELDQIDSSTFSTLCNCVPCTRVRYCLKALRPLTYFTVNIWIAYKASNNQHLGTLSWMFINHWWRLIYNSGQGDEGHKYKNEKCEYSFIYVHQNNKLLQHTSMKLGHN